MDKATLFSYMPVYYKNSKVIDNLNNTNAQELAELDAKLNSVLNQFFIDTSGISLERWEKELGILVDNSKPVEYRRSVIKSKLRGQGTITISLIKNVAESYINGTVDVIEQSAVYQFTVKFIDDLGVPPNLYDLLQAIEDIKPAHLAVVYEYKYYLISDIDQVMTITDIETQPLTNFAPFEPVL